MQSLTMFYHIHQQLIGGVISVISASGIVSVVLQNLKRWLSLQSPRVIHTLLLSLSFCTVAINYLLGAASTNPTILGAQTFLIMGVATSFYSFLVKPASGLLKDAQSERERKARLSASNAAIDNLDVNTAALTQKPAVSIPVAAASEFDA